ncbi:MAG: thioredoxin family protein [Clostridiaceae bacterium]|nr:thioredoxin family protein [Clostridiaceae bacterium]
MFELDKNTFETEILQAEGPVFVDFYGDGCVPCAALKPHILKLEETYGDRIRFTALNTTKARRLAISQRILGLPVVAIYRNGEKVEELVKDDATPEAVEAMLEKYCEDSDPCAGCKGCG